MADVLLTSTEEVIQLVSVSGASQGDITSAVNAHAALATGVHGVGASTVDSVAARDAAVAAHNASATAHGLATAVCDATMNTAAIQAALTAAGADAVVYFMTGRYLINSALIPLAGQTIVGAGWGKTVFYADVTMSQVYDTSRFFRLTSAGVKIRDCGFEGHAFVQCPIIAEADNCTVQNCWFDAASQRGVQADNCSRFYVMDNVFEGCVGPAHTIELTRSSYCQVSRNRILSSAANGIEVPPYTQLAIGNQIIGNYIAACVNGIQLMGDIESIVTGNTIENCTQYGVLCWRGEYPDTQYSEYDTISNNVIRNCGGTTYTGMAVQYSRGHQIIGNVVEGNGGIGIYIEATSTDCIVQGNTARLNRSHGIVISGTGCVAHGNICVDNGMILAGSRSGLVVEASGTVVTCNRCTDTRAPGSKYQQFGLLLSSASNVIVYGNSLIGNHTAGFSDGTASGTGLQAGIDGSAIVKKVLTASASWTPGTIAANAIAWTTVALSGAIRGDAVFVGFTPTTYVGVLLIGTIIADDNITVTLYNKTGVEITLGAGTVRVEVFQH